MLLYKSYDTAKLAPMVEKREAGAAPFAASSVFSLIRHWVIRVTGA